MKRKSNIPGIIRLKKTAYDFIELLDIPVVSCKVCYNKGYSIMMVAQEDDGYSFKFVEKRK